MHHRFLNFAAHVAKTRTTFFTPQRYTVARSFCTSEENMRIMRSDDITKIRNVAIIAHVDHGKTTLVDTLIKQSGLQQQASMDSNQLEREKGITILAKCTSICYKGFKLNLVDTPGHHDFGGEVERIMDMVDGAIIVVCATEGPMAQTKFVVQKALRQNLKPIVVINKVDRPTARIEQVQNEVFGLFCDLELSDDLLDYPILYSSGREGWAVNSIDAIKQASPQTGAQSILDAIIEQVPAPKFSKEGPFQMLVSQSESNQYFGKMMIGRINSGMIDLGRRLNSVDQRGAIIETAKVLKITKKLGQERIEMERAFAGDIVSIAGFTQSSVSHTLNEVGVTTPVLTAAIDPPIMAITFDVNTSPLNGKEGTRLTRSQIRQRLIEEADNDVALRVLGSAPGAKDDQTGAIVVQGRGDLHLGILIETMRREGFEMSVTPPQVLYRKDEHGNELEPIEKVLIEVDPKYIPNLTNQLTPRGGIYLNCTPVSETLHRVEFHVPTRGLIGFRAVLLDETNGTGVMESHVIAYEPHRGRLQKYNKGSIVSMSDGMTTAYALKELEKLGPLFVRPNQKVYPGMVIGEHLKDQDIDVNPTKKKQLTNIRTHEADEKIVLTPPRTFTVEEAVSYIREDEIVEVTPKEIRIRKRELDMNMRRKYARDAKSKN